MDLEAYTATRRALHGVAELLLAGPQHADCAEISLRAVPGGFATAFTPYVAVLGAEIVTDDRRAPLAGRTIREVAAELGLAFTDLAHVYRDVSGIDPDEPLPIDEDAAHRICAAYSVGDAALREFAPEETPVLWPEHFDIAITVDEVNYGVTPGDAGIETPYMYVGPWSVPERDDFWNVSFGAALALPDEPGPVVEFFEAGRERLKR